MHGISTAPWLQVLFFVSFLAAQQTNAQDHTPCDGYWERSYQHLYLEEADSLWELDRYERAAILYQNAAKIFEQDQNWKGYLKSMNRVSSSLRIANQYDTALTILFDNLDIIEEHLEGDPNELAEVYTIMGVNYDWQRRIVEAYQAFGEALEFRLDLFGTNHIDIARVYKSIGEMFWYDDQNLNAVKFLSKATDILEILGCDNAQLAGDTYYVIASAYRELADYEKATIYGLKALSILGENNLEDESRSYQLLGNINLEKGDLKLSRYYLFKAIDIKLQQEPLNYTQKKDLANFLNSVGSIYLDSQDYDSARYYYSQSLKIYQELEGVEGNIFIAIQNIGICYTRLGQYDSANVYLSRAVNLTKEVLGEKNINTSNALRYMGDMFESMGTLDSALYYCQLAIVAGSGEYFNELNINANPGIQDFTFDGSLLNAIWKKGVILRKIYGRNLDRGNLGLSLETLLTAIYLMDQNQKLYQLEGSTLMMGRDYYAVFENALEVCYDLYELESLEKYLESAFMVLENSKSRLLFDTFSDLQQSRAVGIPDSVFEVENSIKARLASFTRDLESEHTKDSIDSQKIRDLEERVFESTVILERFYNSLNVTFPGYTTAIKSELSDLQTIQEELSRDHQILINYFWGDSSLYSLVIKDDQVLFFRQPLDPIKEMVNIYQQHLVNGPQFTNQTASLRDFAQNAHALYQKLLNGINLEKVSLIIAADGPLRLIPFEGLVVSNPETNVQSYDKLQYLVQYFSTSYVYSANLWAMQSTPKSHNLRTLGFSHSILGEGGFNGGNELPGTAEEIEVLKGQLSGLFFSGPEATKQNFIDYAREYDIIHLAIHGISDSISRLNNRLLFRDPDDHDQLDPLYTHELYNMRLNSRLAVLSACESGVGTNFQGEGVYSMSRAFAYAGCPTTVMSLWTISDKTTPVILEQFYRQILKGHPIDQSLRTAKLQYLQDHQGNAAHPSYWAAMVAHGSTKPMVKNSKATSILFVSILILLILTVLLIYKRKRTR